MRFRGWVGRRGTRGGRAGGIWGSWPWIQAGGEERQAERTISASAARASAAVVSKLPEREGVASVSFIHGSFKRFGERFWTCSTGA